MEALIRRILYFVIIKEFFYFCRVYYDFSDFYRVYNKKYGYTTSRFSGMRSWSNNSDDPFVW